MIATAAESDGFMDMICERVQEWLLQADQPARLADAPEGVTIHVRTCADCQRLVRRIGQLERRWREQRLPAAASTARAAFRQRFQPPAQPRPASRRWVAAAVWAVAASWLLTIGLSSWLLLSHNRPKPAAEPDVLAQLIDWNLEMTESADPEKRQQIFARKADALKADLARSPLSGEDRVFAETLYQNGSWLAANEEPLEEADRFNAVADQLLTRMETATDRKDGPATERFARQYGRVAAAGIDAKLERVPPADGEKKGKIDKLQARDAKRLQELERLQDKAPGASKKELKRILEESRHKGKHKPAPKHGKRLRSRDYGLPTAFRKRSVARSRSVTA